MCKSGRCWISVFLLLASLATASGCQSGTTAESNNAPSAKPAPKKVVRGSIEFVEGYSDGYELAQQMSKPMLVFFTARWCNFCHQMEAEAFTDHDVANLSREFVCILVDADQQPDVCREFRVRGYPTIQFLSARGVPLNRLTGKRSPQQLTLQMQAALTATVTRETQTILR